MQNDPVNHPSHYANGRFETIDYIEGHFYGFHLGNAVKYISRAGKKDGADDIQDLEKALWYLRRYKNLCENKNFEEIDPYIYAEDKDLPRHLMLAIEYIELISIFEKDPFYLNRAIECITDEIDSRANARKEKEALE